ncbi:MAG TPA: hypothetical protein DEP48_05300 [Persephonella sp.]|uniref:UbiD family decarboxylase n=1 Tax=Persephonella marina (strain DSM 14350 / EX-H1) TaxID=123214 RepID=C0QPN3_PERMH|nr:MULTISPECIES: DUF6036 family nucleotidyltransferase [Persephonella]ACO04494.1 conserved hypothetical protein [Persephonella marina EX-H1]HCB69756.1 hypothetical protein [Persephonella sp.]
MNLLEKVKAEKDILKKHLLFSAWLSQKLKEKNIPLPVIVGGSALEIYTGGFYLTGDIDLVSPYRDEIEKVILDTGYFRKSGKNLISEKLGLFVEIVDEKLAGSMEKTNIIKIDENLDIRVIGLEDLIIDRLNACVHWKSYSDCEWAEVLIEEFKDKIDLKYLKERAKEEKVDEKLEELIKDEN